MSADETSDDKPAAEPETPAPPASEPETPAKDDAAPKADAKPDTPTAHFQWAKGATTLQQAWTKENGDTYWVDVPVADEA